MNLVPISGGNPAEATSSSLAPEGDFAALMTGLMSGDTQIVPLVDMAVDGALDLDGGQEATESDNAVSILEFVGNPPSGVANTETPEGSESDQSDSELGADGEPARTDHAPAVTRPNLTIVDLSTTLPAASTTIQSTEAPPLSGLPLAAEPLADVPPVDAPPADSPPVDAPPADSPPAAVPPADVPLADVYPIADRVAVPSVTGAETEPRIDAQAKPSATGHTLGFQPLAPPPTPTEAVTEGHGRSAPGIGQAVAAPHPIDSNLIESTTHDEMVNDVEPPADPETETETSPSLRSGESARTGTTPRGPAMVGIARRVEEAIAALATKPDPKVVTLQLDELDGIRLTVALRADGLHLSSNGDASLTAEIERALASRGFEMASDRQRENHQDDGQADDGWKPTTPNRRRRTTPNGITL